MFQNLNLFEFLLKGGFIFILLIACSIFSIALIIERASAFFAIFKESRKVFDDVLWKLKKGNFSEALEICMRSPSLAGKILLSALERKGKPKEKIEEAVQREGIKLSLELEKKLVWLATTGSVAPFIGLFGTVLGIINAFKSISFAEAFSPSLVANGIAEALLNTAAGLFVAVPAVIAYNIFINRLQAFIKEIETKTSEIVEITAG
jgi:biopolymer transport protein ExbB/TolQ